ncbi:MAG: hypothetical protein ACI9WC_002252 [Arenicella sp.]|jgi:hypothetical protein
MLAMPSLLVEELANSQLLPTFLASIEEIPSYFYLVPELC